MGQGIANLVVPFFGGLPVTGTIARTATNAKAGAETPISGMIHACVILLIMVLAAPLARHIPMATLAAILIYIAWGMFDAHEFKRLKHFNLTYRSVLLGTFFLTLIFDLTVAVEVGLVLACIFFIYRISSLTYIEPIELPEHLQASDELHLDDESRNPKVEAYRIYGSLFFGAVDKIEALYDPLDTNRQPANVIILEMHQLISIDTSATDALNTLAQHLKKQGSQLIICALNRQPESLMLRSGFISEIGPENKVANLSEAFSRAQTLLEKQVVQNIG
jgi:SulP family sulfate permease